MMRVFTLLILLAFSGAQAQAQGFTAACEQLVQTGLTGVSADVVALASGAYRMYYMSDGGGGIRSASSSDGIVWASDAGSRLQPPPGDTSFYSNPWVFRLNDGRYRMIYESRDNAGNRRLYSAVSTDTLNFTRESLVLDGTSVDLNGSTVFLSVPAGFRRSDGALQMYFVSDGADTRSALSTNEGLTWVRDAGTRMQKAVDPVVYRDGSAYTMIYTDWSNAYRTKRLLTATSQNGLDFTPTGNILVNITNGTDFVVDPDVITINGRQRLYFSIMSGTSNPIYTCLLPQAAPSGADCLFNWAERNYGSLFSPAGAVSATSSPYYFRYYATSNAYLGVSSADNHVYYLSAGGLQDVGSLSSWLTVAGCS